MDTIKVHIAKDFSPSPGPRYISEGHWSGELFRTSKFFDLVSKALEEDKKIIVDLDGTVGYGTSFLEESFGGLIRAHNIDYNKLMEHLEIISDEEEYLKDDVLHYLKDANEKSRRVGGR